MTKNCLNGLFAFLFGACAVGNALAYVTPGPIPPAGLMCDNHAAPESGAVECSGYCVNNGVCSEVYKVIRQPGQPPRTEVSCECLPPNTIPVDPADQDDSLEENQQ